MPENYENGIGDFRVSWQSLRMRNSIVILLVVWLSCSLLPLINAQDATNQTPHKAGLTKFNRQIADTHKQLYGMSCIPMSIELVLKLLGRVPSSYYELQTPWKEKADGNFRDFNGKTIEAVTFHQQFDLGRNDQFPLAKLFETIERELKAGRFVIVSLTSGSRWHMY